MPPGKYGIQYDSAEARSMLNKHLNEVSYDKAQFVYHLTRSTDGAPGGGLSMTGAAMLEGTTPYTGDAARQLFEMLLDTELTAKNYYTVIRKAMAWRGDESDATGINAVLRDARRKGAREFFRRTRLMLATLPPEDAFTILLHEL